jgi:hypothetical protein
MLREHPDNPSLQKVQVVLRSPYWPARHSTSKYGASIATLR